MENESWDGSIEREFKVLDDIQKLIFLPSAPLCGRFCYISSYKEYEVVQTRVISVIFLVSYGSCIPFKFSVNNYFEP